MVDVILQRDEQEVIIQKSTQIQKEKTFRTPFLDNFRFGDHPDGIRI
jgi:hypothetical protein